MAARIDMKFLSGLAMLNVPDGLALQPGNAGDAGLLVGEQADAAAMDRRGQLHVEALFERLQPAQRHADAGIRLAAREQLQQLVGGAREVDLLDLEIVSREEAALIGDRDARRCRPHWCSSRS